MDENNLYQLTWLPKKTFEVLVTIPKNEIAEARKKVIEEAGKEIEVDGFRKGKAPDDLVIKNLGQNKILQLILEKIVPSAYQKTIQNLKLNPIIGPKIEIVESKEDLDWKIKFISCEEPEIKLGNYKDEIKKIKSGEKIWTPGKDAKPEKTEAKDDQKTKEEKLQKVIEWIIQNIRPEISDLLIEEEVNRKLSNLLDQTQKLGLSIEQYLASTGKTSEQVREEYRKSSYETLLIEFVLNKIAETEQIEIKPEEIEKTIAEIKDEKERKNLEAQKYLLASLLRRQKTLDFLASL